MSLKAPRILVFDSGVGGLSILAEVQKSLPDASFVYLADNEAFPYGTKTEPELISRVNRVLQTALSHYPVELIIIACNSASTIALPHIRNSFSLPVIGVVPAIKPAAALSQSGTIGILATPGTVSRQYTRDLIQQFAAHLDVRLHGSALLVSLAEQKLRGQHVSQAQLRQAIAPLFADAGAERIDTIVLACTHFPLLKQELQAIGPAGINWIDSGEAIARRAQYLVNHLNLDAPRESSRAVFTASGQNTTALQPALDQYGLQNMDYLPIKTLAGLAQ